MGKGDKKSKKGKITMGSYGVRRKRVKASDKKGSKAAVAKKAPAKKTKKAE
ncbi:MAG: 30S ribosomal protein THX [Bacteroidia bacterium]